jgi:uncharacterized protein
MTVDAPAVPVTVSITRRVDPARIAEVTEWVQRGVNRANRYPGFLGSGWVRERADSENWHMLYRFGDARMLDAWESSEERAAWLAEGSDLVEERRVERRTGIEGWFDTPQDGADGPAAPPRWKQAVSIWLGFFPVNLVFTVLVVLAFPWWPTLDVLPRILITTLVLTPIMTYWVLPFVTRMLHPWLIRTRRR